MMTRIILSFVIVWFAAVETAAAQDLFEIQVYPYMTVEPVEGRREA